MANWDSAVRTMMPPRLGQSAVVTSNFAAHSKRSRSPGIDLDWPGAAGEAHPAIFSPIAGTVQAAGSDAWNTVNIIDAEGNRHGFLHMLNPTVRVGQRVAAGQQIGYLGGMGPARGGKSPTAYKDHLHYQLTLKGESSRTDPIAWWNGERDQGDVVENDGATEMPGEAVDGEGIVESGGGVRPTAKSVAALVPKQAAQASASAADKALWTNRVPEHEPWPRCLKALPQKDPDGTQTYDDDTGMAYQNSDVSERHMMNRHHTNEFSDESAWVGRVEGNEFIERNPLWRR